MSVTSSPVPSSTSSNTASNTTSGQPGAEPTQQDPLEAAFEATAAERAALDPAKVPPYTLDAVHASGVARSTSRRLIPLLMELATLPQTPLAQVERVEVYGDALLHIHHAVTATSAQAGKLAELAQEGTQLRQILFLYADLLVATKVFPAEVVAKLKEGAGYRDLIEDLGSLAYLFRQHPEVFQPGAPVSRAMVDRAAAVAALLNAEVMAREEPDKTLAALLLERRRAACLLLRVYSEVRRAVTYLRWHQGDMASISPPLQVIGSRQPRENTPGLVPAPAPVVPAPVAPVPVDPLDPSENPFDDGPQG